jgi:biotin transport system substrate-specific component
MSTEIRYDARRERGMTHTATTTQVGDSRSVRLLADLTVIITGSLVIAALAQLTVPLWPVPVSGQTLGILLAGALLGARRGTATVALYIAEGAAGLPFFAGGRAGIAVLTGPTAGYLIGFVAAVWIVGTLADRGAMRKPITAAATMLAATGVVYLLGCSWLSRFVSTEHVLALGLYPFVVGDLLKAIVVVLMTSLATQRFSR